MPIKKNGTSILRDPCFVIDCQIAYRQILAGDTCFMATQPLQKANFALIGCFIYRYFIPKDIWWSLSTLPYPFDYKIFCFWEDGNDARFKYYMQNKPSKTMKKRWSQKPHHTISRIIKIFTNFLQDTNCLCYAKRPKNNFYHSARDFICCNLALQFWAGLGNSVIIS